MPELPEVENVVRSLAGNIEGKVITRVEVMTAAVVYGRNDFENLVSGRTIKELRRRGKYIIIKLDEGNLLIHLRMTGKLLYNRILDKHTHLVFYLEGSDILSYSDVRKFGRISFLTERELEDYIARKVGLEPGLMSLDEFKEKFSKKKGAVKKVLLDQGVVAGIGNIYADEILYASRIHPLKSIEKLSDVEIKSLYDQIRFLLERATELGGSTIKDYVNGNGQYGRFQDFHEVYGRSGNKCRCCGSTLEKIKVAGRTTVFCPVCQQDYIKKG